MEYRKNSDDSRIKCPICSKRFNTIGLLIAHLIDMLLK